MTALAGLPPYLELAVVSGLTDSIRRHMQVCAEQEQGWTDEQIVPSTSSGHRMGLVLLNIAGGNCVDDPSAGSGHRLRILEKDDGFARVLRREQELWRRKERKRTVPSQSVIFRYLAAFHNPGEEAKRVVGHAFIPKPNERLQTLGQVNESFLRFAQQKSPQREATLEQDASVVETHKREALFSYQGCKAYQPLTIRWAEQDMIIDSECRVGNVPAGYGNLRILQRTLAALPDGVMKVYFLSDTAAYQRDLLCYRAEGILHAQLHRAPRSTKIATNCHCEPFAPCHSKPKP